MTSLIPKLLQKHGICLDGRLEPPKTCAVKKIGEIFRNLRDARGLTQLDVANALGVSDETISRIESGKLPSKGNTLARLAEHYNSNLETVRLLAAGKEGGEVVDRIPGNFTIRRISGVAATDFSSDFEVDLMNEEGVPGYLYPFPMQDPMVLRVVGSSMSYDGRDSIEEGDDVIFANGLEEEIADGEIVVARHRAKETQTVKVLRRLPKTRKLQLVPLNPKFKPIEIAADQVDLRVVKVVVRYRYKWARP